MSESATPQQHVPEEIAERIAGVLIALSDVAEGNFDVQMAADLPESHPLGALTAGINQMTRALQSARQESAASQREVELKLELIEKQKAAMRELATPIIELWDGVLCLPVVGVIDTVRSTEMTDALLQAVVSRPANCAIIDITGIDVMDTRTADHFLRMAQAVGLLGARCVLTGINPMIAQTIVHMGVDMSGVECHRNLRDALKLHLRALEDERIRERARARERAEERAEQRAEERR